MTAESETLDAYVERHMKRWAEVAVAAGAILYILSVPFLMWWDGYVLVALWRWFAVPLGAPIFGIWHAVGLIAIWNHLRASAWDMKRENPTSWERLAHALIAPAAALLVGYLVKTLALS